MASDFVNQPLVTTAVDERVTVALEGTVTIPEGAAGTAAQARILCFAGDNAKVRGVSIVSTQTTNATVTTE